MAAVIGSTKEKTMTKESSMKPANPRILTINGGSSSIKFALYQVGEAVERRLYGKIDAADRRQGHLPEAAA